MPKLSSKTMPQRSDIRAFKKSNPMKGQSIDTGAKDAAKASKQRRSKLPKGYKRSPVSHKPAKRTPYK